MITATDFTYWLSNNIGVFGVALIIFGLSVVMVTLVILDREAR